MSIIMNGYRGSGFRYLHDEVSGGIAAFSHLKTRAAYIGDCVNIGTTPNQTDYGFVNDFVDLSQVDSDFATNQDVNTYYDQFGNNDASGSNGTWQKTSNEFFTPKVNGLRKIGGLSGGFNSLDLTDEMTFIIVMNAPSPIINTFQYCLWLQGLTSELRLYWFTNNNFAAQINSGSFSRREWDIGRNDDEKILIITKSSGTTNSSWTMYQSDMENAVSVASNAGNGTPTNETLDSAISLGARLTANYTGLLKEVHVFDTVLNQSDRETAKEILEQYYTFS